MPEVIELHAPDKIKMELTTDLKLLITEGEFKKWRLPEARALVTALNKHNLTLNDCHQMFHTHYDDPTLFDEVPDSLPTVDKEIMTALLAFDNTMHNKFEILCDLVTKKDKPDEAVFSISFHEMFGFTKGANALYNNARFTMDVQRVIGEDTEKQGE